VERCTRLVKVLVEGKEKLFRALRGAIDEGWAAVVGFMGLRVLVLYEGSGKY